MQKFVGERLPNFTEEQTRLVQGSADVVGVNHYTTYYVKNHENLTHMSYANDWQAQLVCTYTAKLKLHAPSHILFVSLMYQPL
jgi:hypothetical protein